MYPKELKLITDLFGNPLELWYGDTDISDILLVRGAGYTNTIGSRPIYTIYVDASSFSIDVKDK